MITEKCPNDGLPHIFIPYTSPTINSVFCQKCLTTAGVSNIIDLPANPIPTPIPPNPDPRPVVIFTPTPGVDVTVGLQAWMNIQPSNAIWDIRGIANINASGLRMPSRINVKLTSSTGGGFKAIGTGLYSTPYSSLLYAASTTDCQFDLLKFDGNGKNAQALFVHHSLRPVISRCEAWNIQNILLGGAPFAALKADDCTDADIYLNNVHDLGGLEGDSGVRGIWCGVGGEYSIRPKIHDNTVTNCGHTGIVTESSGPIVTNNKVYRCLIQGTGYKFVPRGAATDAIWDNNLVDGTIGGGFMIEGSGVFPPHIFVRGWQALNVGKAGTTFGFVYISGSAQTHNVEISGNTLTNCRHIANVNYGWDLKFTNNTVTNGPNLIALENEAHNIVVTNSGSVEVGQNVTNVIVDGVVIVK